MSVKKFYKENGYVVVHNLIKSQEIDKLLGVYNNEIVNNKKIKLKLMDKQTYTKGSYINNFLQNPIADPHNIKYKNKKLFKFGDESLKIILNNNIYKILKKIYGKTQYKLLMSMFFDQNSGTPAHQDCYYLDSLPIGNMTAAWIALEDINEYAGRFYVIPKSHKRLIYLSQKETNTPSLYEKKIENIIRKEKLKIVAPKLKKGSVLFWNSGTIHGSLKTKNNKYSRKSFTCHFIPGDFDYLRNRYTNEVRTYKSFKYKQFVCKINSKLNTKPKKYKIRNISSFNKQEF
jgi:phytanoyl-CoA hydroxylase